MPTTRVPAYRCGTNWSGWLMTTHPTLEDGEVLRTVCFSDRSTGCKHSNEISVKNCGSYFIYEFFLNHLVVIRATVLQTECNAKTSTK